VANPVLSRAGFADAHAAANETPMTLAGTISKTAMLMVLCAFAAGGVWATSSTIGPSIGTALTIAAVAGFALAIGTTFMPRWAPITAPLYALVEGVLLGGVTLLINARYAGLPLMALGLTILAGGTMLGLYATRVVRVTQRMRAIVTGAIVAIVLYYVVAMVLGFFHVQMPLLQGSGWLSIGFSLLVCGVATMSFLLDFDMVERAVNNRAPHYFEWYGAFGILVTFIWLYFEVLRLLMELSGRRR
jgi:uncharacterized YccA/Bax inhibitor family protein